MSRDIQVRPQICKPWNHPALRLVGCFVFILLGSLFVDLSPLAELVWVANGVLLAYLLLGPFPRRRRADEAREFQHSLIEAIHTVSLDGILVVDENEMIVSCNWRFAEIWRLRLPEASSDIVRIRDAE